MESKSETPPSPAIATKGSAFAAAQLLFQVHANQCPNHFQVAQFFSPDVVASARGEQSVQCDWKLV
jgi:hypothetical protein